MQRFHFRSGVADDTEAIFEVMVRAFHVEENSDRWHSWHKLAVRDAGRFRVLEVEGRVLGVAIIKPERLCVGSCEIVKADVGEVSVLPQFQGKGYGSALMRDVIQWMRDNDCDMSRLGGSAIFYRRFGYVPFPRRSVVFPIEPVHAGADIVSVEEVFRPPEGLPGEVRPYDASRDAVRKDELHQLLHRGRSGSIVRDFHPNARLPSRPSSPDPLRIVYEADGIVEGYLSAGDDGRSIGDVAFNPACPDAFVGLMKQILHVAAERGVDSATSCLPFDASILPILSGANIAFTLIERQGGRASNMIQIVQLASLLSKMAPELESRLRSSSVADWRGEIEVGFESQRVGLRVGNGSVTTNVPLGDGAFRMQTDQGTLMKLLLGILSFEEAPTADRESIHPSAAAVLSAWFPRRHTASGPWG
ncbi:GNAT family N-acetyltransferase [Candidatus Poribacteria bacterium]|jgi:predicted N-acetyltransferase YhbS|nr:GNAT family N-acetyltransferase [Candidatus Poribacteria bacterium]MBT5534787.1 GNAT family N-acetyltransferase [Candidatus Poribacteria bacterium]MBT5715120.1 GNAT family N-acetyltransferase [Candidatus Poribacteria bacterium]MBT7098186.1 GNAT family N-acetyltransferase [Candidatus Poribacteria bacterium]MBT7809074.1 GNAT family N-acetyltransferase [Candidatus Poribacteria bacterium]